MTDVLKAQVSHVDPERNWPGVNEDYSECLPVSRPVRSYFGATWFRPLGQLLQIDRIA